MIRVLVLGANSVFITRLLQRLDPQLPLQLILAGRNLASLRCLRAKLAQRSISIVQIDLSSADWRSQVSTIQPDLCINAAGPYSYQGQQSFALARHCCDIQSHYFDLADNAEYVKQFAPNLDAAAKQAGVALISGASSVPALSCAVIEHYARLFDRLTAVDYGICPGNCTQRGHATVASILNYCGQPIVSAEGSRPCCRYGWQDVRRYNFNNALGKRWLANCEIPDVHLFAERFPTIERLRFQAGLELSFLHLGLWGLSWLVRVGLVKNLAQYSRWIWRISTWFMRFGSDRGGMFMVLQGQHKQQLKRITWQLTAHDDRGPEVPTIALELAIEQCLAGKLTPGARPCMGLFTLDDFSAKARALGIECASGALEVVDE